LSLTNRQRFRPVKLQVLRRILGPLIQELLGPSAYDLSICLVSSSQMAQLNESFLRHSGPTDVLAFDYSESGHQALRGEIFICVEVAVAQARRFRTSWQSELVRYVVHGLLHLKGYDDHLPAGRRRMKREEGRLMRLLKGSLTDL
jgi:probable rRNA maturation factor